MRKVPIVPNEYYHIYNRGNNKQDICMDARDYTRLLFLIIYFQSPLLFQNISRNIMYFVEHGSFPISEALIKEIVNNRTVELVNFTLMPNHYHLTVTELTAGGISEYMQRIGTAFTKYSNTKYERSGHVFQGTYQTVHVKNDNQLSYLSAYIHRNPRELRGWKNKEHLYSWSSFQDYVTKNRWGALLQNDIVMERFKNGKEYKEFVEQSGAKEIEKHLSKKDLLI